MACRQFIIVSYFILYTSLAFCQAKKSLAAEDLNRANAYLKQAEELTYTDIDSMLMVTKKAFQIAEAHLQSKIGNITEFVKIKGTALNNISYHYYETGNVEEAKNTGLQAYQLLESVKAYALLASCCSNLAAFNESEGNIDLSKMYFEKALNFAIRGGDSLGIADSYNSLAYIYNNNGEILKSIQFFEDALRIQYRIKDSVGVANSLFNLGSIYVTQDEVENGIAYLQKSASAFEQIGDDQGLGSAIEH